MPLHLPLIDLSNFIQGSVASRRVVVDQIDQACREVGFFYCRNLGISQPLIQHMFAQSRSFFALPEAAKNRVAWSNSESNRGYIGLRRESLDPSVPGDLKEAFNVGQERLAVSPSTNAASWMPQNQWPAGAAPFRTTALQFYRACAEAVDVLLAALAIALQLPGHFFIDRHQQRDYTLRLLHYPPLAAEAAGTQIRAGEHSDYGSLTLLFQDDMGGLEVQTAGGDWLTIPPLPDTVIVNVGDLLQRWTNDRFWSAVHRVRLSQPQQTARSRYSIAFFCQPDFDVEIACLPACQSSDRPPRYAPIGSGEYLLSRLNATY